MAHKFSIDIVIGKGNLSHSSLDKNYELFEHTADIGLRVRGKDLKSLFKNAGLAIFQISSRKQITRNTKLKILKITQKADSLDELFINWLNELLSLSSAKGLIFEAITMDKIDERSLKAEVKGCDIKYYKVDKEIKAATYHGLEIKKEACGWQAEVILDV